MIAMLPRGQTEEKWCVQKSSSDCDHRQLTDNVTMHLRMFMLR